MAAVASQPTLARENLSAIGDGLRLRRGEVPGRAVKSQRRLATQPETHICLAADRQSAPDHRMTYLVKVTKDGLAETPVMSCRRRKLSHRYGWLR